MDMERELYEDIVLDHNRNPRNYPKHPEGTNCSAHGFNPYCGDDFKVYLKVENNIIEDIGFEGGGCAISTASASMMTEAVIGKHIEEVETLFDSVHNMLTSEKKTVNNVDSALMDKLAILASVKEYPMRVKCATLAWHTMHAALHHEDDTVCTE